MTSAALIARQMQERAKRTQHEDALMQQLTALKLTEGLHREFEFSTGRKWRFDFAYPELKIAIEVEGGIWVHGRHSRGAGMEADMEKYNAAARLGWVVLRFSSRHIKVGEAAKLICEMVEGRR